VIRRLFSKLKGGRLARLAAPAKITQFLLSDVPDDRLESIASGVAAADPVPLDYAKELVKNHRLDQLAFVAKHMAALAKNDELAPVRPSDPCLERVNSTILASNAQCREAAANCLATKMPGLVQVNAPELAGEAQQMAQQFVTLVCQHKAIHSNSDQIFGIVSGGETVVSMDSAATGRGGRSQELALAFACHMRKAGALAPANWAVLAGGTDGRDGPTDAAGGILTSRQNFDLGTATIALQSHDSYHFLTSQNSLVKTGATGTNLADLVLIVWSG
jgi:glycerate 2-kinase